MTGTAVARRDLLLLAAAIFGICMTGPIIAASPVPALALAAWRCAVGAVLIGVVTVFIRSTRRQWRSLNRKDVLGVFASGLFLAAHFATWVPSIRLTTVASSTALVATQPIWAALIARSRGHVISRGMWIGIGLALLGTVSLTAADFVVASPRALLGDVLALLGAVLAAAYVTVGERVRARVSTSVYSVGVYSVASVLLAITCVVAGQSLWGWTSYSAVSMDFMHSGWGSIIGLTVFGQLIGHTLINQVVPRMSATVTSTAILFEMPGSTLVAAVWLRQAPPVAVWPALGLVLLGLVVVVRHHARESSV
jgi:drug/metabolite transporter (DMT)-like permease